MKRLESESYNSIRKFLDKVPVIDTHEHFVKGTKIEKIDNVLEFAVATYYISDCQTVSPDLEEAVSKAIRDPQIDLDERYAIFGKAYEKSKHTAYAKSVHLGLEACLGVKDLSRESLEILEEKVLLRNDDYYEKLMQDYHIECKVLNIYEDERFNAIIDGNVQNFSKYCKFAFPLVSYHTVHHITGIRRLDQYIGRKIITLDDYVEAFDVFFKKAVDFGIVCLKDQSAYIRKIDYKNVTKHEAEKVFNDIMMNPEEVMNSERARVLNDWLFHYFMRLAQKYKLPVQLHTGHMAGIRNEIEKTNAVHLTKLIQMYSDVKFDLFHGNWPYMGEYLFLGKNYPNVYLDLCWVQGIDPIYSIELMKRSVLTMPHNKLLVFGGDTDYIEQTIGFLIMARDNVANALSQLVDEQWITMDEAKRIACDWFYNNPNELFDLGFDTKYLT